MFMKIKVEINTCLWGCKFVDYSGLRNTRTLVTRENGDSTIPHSVLVSSLMNFQAKALVNKLKVCITNEVYFSIYLFLIFFDAVVANHG
jgi:hypothetical protein